MNEQLADVLVMFQSSFNEGKKCLTEASDWAALSFASGVLNVCVV